MPENLSPKDTSCSTAQSLEKAHQHHIVSPTVKGRQTMYTHTTKSLRLAQTLAVAIVFSTLFFIWIQAKQTALVIPTYHLDGAFQTASGLTRLASGQLPGRDFFPYLGIGPTFSIYPLFQIDGTDMAATLFSAYASTLVFYVIALGVLAKLTSPTTPWLKAFAAGAVALVALFFLRKLVGANPTDFPLWPGNSLRPIRAVLPYIVGGAFFWILCQRGAPTDRTTRFQATAMGTVCGGALLWSNDTAYLSAILGALVGAYLLLPNVPRTVSAWALHAALFVAAALTTAVVAYTLVTGGHPIAMATFNFRDAAPDQWWYYVVGDTSLKTRVYTTMEVPAKVWNNTETAVGMIALIVALWGKARRRAPGGVLNAYIGMCLFWSGTLTCIGGQSTPAYMVPFMFWGILSLLFLCIEKIWCKVPAKAQAGGWAVAFLAIVGVTQTQYNAYTSYREHLAESEKVAWNKELGAYVEREHAVFLETTRVLPRDTTVEEYWGMWSAAYGGNAPSLWKVDATIHALGDVRDQSAAAIDRATHVITSYPAGLGEQAHWQKWGMIQNFWFYQKVLEGFVPQDVGPNTVVWRRATPKDGVIVQEQSCTITPDRRSIHLVDAPTGLYGIDLVYEVKGTGRFHLVVDTGSDTKWDASLDTNGTDARFPVWVHKGAEPVYKSQLLGGTQRAVALLECTAKRIKNPGLATIQATARDTTNRVSHAR